MNHNIQTDELNQLSTAEQELRNGKIGKLFIKFAIPSVVGLISLGIQSIIDGIILGNYVGVNALASVNLAIPCFTVMTASSIIIGVGCQTIVSICLGKLDRKGANNALFSGLIFTLLYTFLGGIILFLFAEEIARMLGANDALLAYSTDYIRILAPFFSILALSIFCDYILKALGHTVYAMVIMFISVLANIVLDLLFVVHFNMSVTGAGLATGLAISISAFMGFIVILKEKTKIQLSTGKFRWSLVGRMLYNGSSEGASELSSGITILIFNIVLMKYLGEIGVAAFTALQYILFLCILIFLGISNGIVPIVSYNYGANNWSRIRKVLGLAIKTNFLIGLILFLLMIFFGEEVTRLFFQSNETRVIEIATQGVHLFAFAFLFSGLNILASSYFTAIADAKTSIIIALLRGLVVIAPCIVIFPLLFGIEGVWLAIPVAEFLTLFVSFFLVKRSFRAGEQLIK